MAVVVAFLAFCALLGFPAFQAAMVLPGNNIWKLTQVSSFSWSNCEGTFPGEIHSLSLSPDPVNIPGDIKVKAEGSTTVPLTSPVKVAIKLQKEILDLWVDVPCVDHIGSCTYDNVCDILDNLIPPGQPCPEPLETYGILCHCPFKAGVYSFPESNFYLPDVSLPSWAANGNYRTTVTVSSGNQVVGCIKITFSLKSNSGWHWK
ncbi:ganglioside GM2 activator [Microcaecilia unicolor]|uniref:Ganglioside GM2 activator n=1 Tax=Microcaecilia unicolor TaxID=1415580 RepID=A0A6P7YSC1_9AMPH|nr:ganglioside GM2 activator [Microcaecilia unicolor]